MFSRWLFKKSFKILMLNQIALKFKILNKMQGGVYSSEWKGRWANGPWGIPTWKPILSISCCRSQDILVQACFGFQSVVLPAHAFRKFISVPFWTSSAGKMIQNESWLIAVCMWGAKNIICVQAEGLDCVVFQPFVVSLIRSKWMAESPFSPRSSLCWALNTCPLSIQFISETANSHKPTSGWKAAGRPQQTKNYQL